MTRHAYLDGTICVVVVETGVPERHDYVLIGVGATWVEALESLETTPIESVGRDNGRSEALRWAAHSGWCSPLDALVPADVDVDLEQAGQRDPEMPSDEALVALAVRAGDRLRHRGGRPRVRAVGART